MPLKYWKLGNWEILNWQGERKKKTQAVVDAVVAPRAKFDEAVFNWQAF